MSYNVSLNKKLPEQGVYDQLLGGHIEDRKLIKLYPRGGSGPYYPNGLNRIEFRFPDQGHIDTLRSYLTFDLEVTVDMATVNRVDAIELFDFTNINRPTNITYVGQCTSELGGDAGNQFQFNPLDKDAVQKDYLAHILGGYNGSTASLFSMLKVSLDNECIEELDEYHGLSAMLNTNIPNAYRKCALGQMQFLSPRGSREMILNALVRGGSVLTRRPGGGLDEVTEYNHSSTLDGDAPKHKINSGTSTVTSYPRLMHTPNSGVLSNSKLLPAKFMAPIDIEFTLAKAEEALQIASGFAVNKFVSTDIGAFFAGTPRLVLYHTGSSVTRQLGGYYNDDTQYSLHVWQYVRVALNNPPANTANYGSQNIFDGQIVNHHMRESVQYAIKNPVYHVEQVYMSDQYDTAFAAALTRGVTYAYETYAHSSSTMTTDGITQIPTTKTSVKSILTGFVNATARQGVLANYWHFVNPNITEVQLRFGSKMLPSEPMEVEADNGLRALTMFLKATGQSQSVNHAINYSWSVGEPDSTSTKIASARSLVDSSVVEGVFGASETGPTTWCRCTADWPNDTQAHLIDEYPSTMDISNLAPNQNMVYSYNNSQWTPKHLKPNFNRLEYKELAKCIYHYNVGSFVLGMDLEAESGALSGYNTSMSTSMLQWDIKMRRTPKASMNVHTWLRHDKALRLEPQGRATIILD